MINVYMSLGIVRFVPPKGVDKEGADAMSKGIEFNERYGHVLTQACNALRAEPKRLDACDNLSQHTGFAWMLQCCALKWYQKSSFVLRQMLEFLGAHRQIIVVVVLQDDCAADSIEGYVDGPRKDALVQLGAQVSDACLLLFTLSRKHFFAVTKEHSQPVWDTEYGEDWFAYVCTDPITEALEDF